jgi:Tripartite tricarboxylate transporter TctB family
MRRSGEVLFSLLIVVVAAWVVYQSAGWALRALGLPIASLFPSGWGPRSGLFPLVIGLPVLIMSVAQLTIDIRGGGRTASADGTVALDLAPEVVRQRSLVIICTIVGFAVAIWLLGFTIAIPLVTFLFLKFPSHESWTLSITLSVVTGLMFYMLFVYWLNIPAPPGVLLSPLLEYE